ncbi:LysR family transcriptional regulator [Oceanicella sp. SM1341]|uniref:LysR family transcriptional regulator n=1 Tax=Oceanicella sp. SM1341 TaxID=1548889 RepID=UPI001E3E2FCB|nr:LysR family transcriptional regulator [Oceanicella sp. SM1341]
MGTGRPPQPPEVSLRLLEIFGAMMRCETTVEAAELLGISQPAVSNGIRQLESQLGVTLFERLHRRLHPTEEATLLFEEIRPVFGMLRGFTSRARDIRQGHSGRLRIMATPPLGHTVAPAALRNLLRDRPEVSVSYDVRRLENVVEAVKDGSADIGLALALERHPAVHVEVLHRGHMVAMVPAASPLAARAEVTAHDLAEQGFIGLENESRLGKLVQTAFERDGAEYAPRVEVRYCSTAAVLANAELGAAVVDPFTARFHGAPGMVVRPFMPPSEVAAVLILRRGVPRSRLLHSFIAELKAVFQEPGAFT